MIDTYRPVELFVTYENELEKIDSLTNELLHKYLYAFDENNQLSRKLVSFQANKDKPQYRWYKFKEAFSEEMVKLFLSNFKIEGKILDPFAGSGTSLFTAAASGLHADGIELLPLAQKIIDARITATYDLQKNQIEEIVNWSTKKEWEIYIPQKKLPTLRISTNAYPIKTVIQIEAYLELISQFPNSQKEILFFALLCVLEDVSYTRKDGQYLRWDSRAKRNSNAKKEFQKKTILEFSDAIIQKINQISFDLLQGINQNKEELGLIRLFKGSNLEILPTIASNAYDCIITSPPYCNRYDYTRTYALELALMGLSDVEVIELRQQMLSSTVENRKKELTKINSAWENVISITENQELLQAILEYLHSLRVLGKINNSGIPRMVQGYFEEMTCIITECYRVLKPGKAMIVVNDNVRYEGLSIPVDLILSDIANKIGFSIEKIFVLQDKKGNSSQQMGKHGKDNLRKCVYVWRKP